MDIIRNLYLHKYSVSIENMFIIPEMLVINVSFKNFATIRTGLN